MNFPQKHSEPIHLRKKLNLPLTAWLSYLLVAVVLTTAVSFSRYFTFSSGGDSARVARYAFDVKGGTTEQEFTVDLAGIKMPGDTASVTFTVTNTDENGVCEVAQQYHVYVTELGSLPLTYSIGSTNAEAKATGSETALYTGELPAGTEESHTVTLHVSWPNKPETNINYAGGVASLHIRIVAEQID